MAAIGITVVGLIVCGHLVWRFAFGGGYRAYLIYGAYGLSLLAVASIALGAYAVSERAWFAAVLAFAGTAIGLWGTTLVVLHALGRDPSGWELTSLRRFLVRLFLPEP